jgi:hypothetical protein
MCLQLTRARNRGVDGKRFQLGKEGINYREYDAVNGVINRIKRDN